jgi:hypothetical protein
MGLVKFGPGAPMIPNVELAKELVTHVDDGRQCFVLRAQSPARRDARLQSDRRYTCLFYTHSRTLDPVVMFCPKRRGTLVVA